VLPRGCSRREHGQLGGADVTKSITVCIYGLYHADNPSRILYVGETRKTLKYRMAGHWAAARSGDHRPLYAWMRQQARELVMIKELETCNFTDRHSREQAWAENCETQIELGGFNERLGMVTSTAMARRISEAKTGKPLSAAHRAAVSATLTGQPAGPVRTASLVRFYAQPENREVMRERQAKSLHVRWHVKRDIVKPDCALCSNQDQQHLL
jgi:hypothetical protein